MLFDLKNQKHDGRTYTKTSDDISTNRRNESLTSIVHPPLRFVERTERRYVYKWYGVLVSILYTHCVVGGVVNCTGVIYGVRTSLFLTSQRMPSRYGCGCKAIQLMILSAHKISIDNIFGEIFYEHTYGCMLL